jgi:peptidoglycan/xylan/chitin deacetylase (PgdA/CDA1 family)
MLPKMRMDRGSFLISLDFELYWGVRDSRAIEDCRENILGARKAIPVILDVLQEYAIRATWATVGFLFFDRRADLIAACPRQKPRYRNESLSPYNALEDIGESEAEDPFHFGKSLVHLIRSYPGQEIGSHTFSHYYCLEPGQDEAAFRADIQVALETARRQDIDIKSLVFPRNQANRDYLRICDQLGIQCYRGTEQAWFYAKGKTEGESLSSRGFRLADAYLNISGYNTYTLGAQHDQGPVNLPSSMFLRPYNSKLAFLEPLRRKRITRALEHAARHGETYHLWWHPHNYGTALNENIAFLRKVLDSFRALRDQYGMESLTMSQAAERIQKVDDSTTENLSIGH